MPVVATLEVRPFGRAIVCPIARSPARVRWDVLPYQWSLPGCKGQALGVGL